MAPPIDLPGALGAIEVPADWLKACRRTLWGDGVRAVAQPAVHMPQARARYRFSEVPAAVVPDGTGGAFVLATRSETWPLSQGAFSFAHVDAGGARDAVVDLADPGYWVGELGVWAEGAMVASGRGRVIVATFDPSARLRARRLDATGHALWRRPSPLSRAAPTEPSVIVLNLLAEPSTGDGALFAWRQPTPAGTTEACVQRIDARGRVHWGANGVSVGALTGARWPAPQPWMQLVATRGGGAIVVFAQAAGTAWRLVAVAIAPDGMAGAPVTLVMSTPDDWSAMQRVRVAVTDAADGLFLAYVDGTGGLRALRFSPTQGLRWNIPIAVPLDARAFWIREDDRGGALVAWLEGADARLGLRRLDAQGATTWDIAVNVALPPITLALPAGAAAWRRDAWARLVHPLPHGGGAMVVFGSTPDATMKQRVLACCFDDRGALANDPEPITARATGQSLPVAASIGTSAAVVAWADDGSARLEGLDVWAQRIGCCSPQGDPPPLPPFGCEILPLPGMGPGEIALELPCGNATRPFGVIPLSRMLDSVRGLDIPPALLHRGARAPRWFRLLLLDVPEGLSATICTLAGKTVADATPLRGSAALALTFRPPANDADLLVVFSHVRACPSGSRWTLRLATDYGDGRVPALPKVASVAQKLVRDPPTRR